MGDAKAERVNAPPAKAAAPARASAEAGAAGPSLSFAPQDAIGNTALAQLLAGGAIRRKLALSEPGDPDEREADRFADHVVSSLNARPSLTAGRRSGHVHRKCACGGVCEECQREQLPPIHRKAESGATSSASSREARGLAGRLGAGHALDSQQRARFEPHLGRDLGNVRIHTSTAAADTARTLHADAFTIGHDVAFAAGRYAPETSEGTRLLAHELAHVAQHGDPVSAPMRPAPRIHRQQASTPPPAPPDADNHHADRDDEDKDG